MHQEHHIIMPYIYISYHGLCPRKILNSTIMNSAPVFNDVLNHTDSHAMFHWLLVSSHQYPSSGILICARVKTRYKVYGHPSHNGNTCNGYINPY